MLTADFNSVAEHQRETDFNYAMKGNAEEIGRIATTSFQEHKSDKAIQDNKKKHNETLHRVLRAQEAEEATRRLDVLLAQLKEYKEELEAEEKGLKDLEEIKANQDLDAAKDALEARGIDTEDMSEKQIWDAIDEQIAATEIRIEDLEAKIEGIAQECEKELVGLDANDPEHKRIIDEYTEKLEDLKVKAANSGIEGVRFDEKEKNVRTETDFALLQNKVHSAVQQKNELYKPTGSDEFGQLSATTTEEMGGFAGLGAATDSKLDGLKGKLVENFGSVMDGKSNEAVATLKDPANTTIPTGPAV